jgi:predicted dehydrogenase
MSTAPQLHHRRRIETGPDPEWQAEASDPCPSNREPENQATSIQRPRLGFLGVGWIGRHRLEAIARSGVADITALADPAFEIAAKAAQAAPRAKVFSCLEDLLDCELHGIVIATPSALHAEQALMALARGVAVFCQKPLGRTAAETCRVIQEARRSDLLLGVDLSYRFMSGTRKIHELCSQGELGEIFAADLVFHNAYGPDKAWFYDPKLSGGGCVIDLGIHLVDLALWILGFPRVARVTSRLLARGNPITARAERVEDYAEARLDLESGAVIRLACSWNLPAGCDAIISGAFYGTKGGARFANVDGSFYHFQAERFTKTERQVLAAWPEEWGGRAAVDWAQRLASGAKFDGASESLGQVAAILDAIYREAEPSAGGTLESGSTQNSSESLKTLQPATEEP